MSEEEIPKIEGESLLEDAFGLDEEEKKAREKLAQSIKEKKEAEALKKEKKANSKSKSFKKDNEPEKEDNDETKDNDTEEETEDDENQEEQETKTDNDEEYEDDYTEDGEDDDSKDNDTEKEDSDKEDENDETDKNDDEEYEDDYTEDGEDDDSKDNDTEEETEDDENQEEQETKTDNDEESNDYYPTEDNTDSDSIKNKVKDNDDSEEDEDLEDFIDDKEVEEEKPEIIEDNETQIVKPKHKRKASDGVLQLQDDNAAVDMVRPELKLLTDAETEQSFIGRKKSVFEKYGDEASLLIGKLEEQGAKPSKIYLDSLHPHVLFVCGSRGSGKSYVMGVIAEELAKKNKDVGVIVVDPVGVFWSMRFANKEEKEVEILKKWGLEPEGLDNLKVFIPKGNENDTPKSTYDKTFSIKPGLLTSQDWALTFGMERFSPSGLLLEKVMEKVRDGYKEKEDGEQHRGKGTEYSLTDIINCLTNDEELNSRDKGYKADSIRALVSRFEAAKNWGIFHERGTPLGELSRAGQLTILDTSFLDDSVTALVIGILARRILAARKLTTRKEAAKRLETIDVEDLLENDIPPTWLFLDEAHTLIPAGNLKTPATDSIIEYVKQGRRPGCSLVFATQQPTAIDARVLSQLDIILVHKLIFNDDIKSVFKRTPTVIPHKYKLGNFIKTLPVGRGLLGDRREETSRAFVMSVRPRMSQHEGREAETSETGDKLTKKQVHKLLYDLLLKKVEGGAHFLVDDYKLAINSLNRKNDTDVTFEELIKKAKKKGVMVDEEKEIILLEKEFETRQVEEEKRVKKEAKKLKKEEKKRKEREKAANEEEDDDEEEDDIDEEDDAEEDDEETDEDNDEEYEDDYTEDKEEDDSEDKIDVERKSKEIDYESGIELLCFAQRIDRDKAKDLANKERKKRFLGVIGSEEYLESVELKHIPVYNIEFEYRESDTDLKLGEFYVNSITGEFLHYKNDKFIESKGMQDIYVMTDKELAVVNNLGKTKKTAKQVAQSLKASRDAVGRELENLELKKIVKSSEKKGERFFSLAKPFEVPPTPFHPMLISVKNAPVRKEDVLSKERSKYSHEDIKNMVERLWKKLKVRKIREIYWPSYKVEYKIPNGNVRTVYICASTGERLDI